MALWDFVVPLEMTDGTTITEKEGQAFIYVIGHTSIEPGEPPLVSQMDLTNIRGVWFEVQDCGAHLSRCE